VKDDKLQQINRLNDIHIVIIAIKKWQQTSATM